MVSYEAEPFQFRRLMLFAHEANKCKFKNGGKTKSGFDDVGLLFFLFKKSFRKKIPVNYDELIDFGKKLSINEASTGDIAIFVNKENNKKNCLH